MLMSLFKPLLEEGGLIDKNDASDPMNAAIGLADTTALIEFAKDGIETVGGMGDGIDFSGVMPAPTPAPAMEPVTPTLQAQNLPDMTMKMGP